jgi:hypothetical protein
MEEVQLRKGFVATGGRWRNRTIFEGEDQDQKMMACEVRPRPGE